MQQAKEAAYCLLDKQVHDPIVREKLRSHENFGCKRRLVLDDYYPIFNEPNVELVTDPVAGLTEDGIVSRNRELNENEEKKVDVLIWGTGRNFKSGLLGR
jgi:cation diffusion facilitator CzcD-associated flavoprotein CzcO